MTPRKKGTPPDQPVASAAKGRQPGADAKTSDSPPADRASLERRDFFPVVGIGA